ncbi:S-layer glycoprotein N-glycosyltransferase AglJ [Salinibaculum rarum]|uniref:S-layer glycoprotein N-glycosyltransferase AglJ n=1 Tax=Salinibaculum rarum TaxID=3058903 RepID=UPI00265E78B7|nr:S-layer glycoprotein N-glycosyltransferase AglJ [Salinibaculum sp. KK48]
MGDPDDVCVLVPTYEEAETIGQVVDGFVAEGFENVLVIDGGSTDGTREIASDHGARVVVQSGSGKGQAVREAMDYIDSPYVLMADGDATYRADEAAQMLEPLFTGEAEHVIGNRFANMKPGAMSRLNQIGNGIINRAFSYIHGRDLRDILSGYRAFTHQSFQRLSLTADGFGIETEMAVECVKHNVRTSVVPITYQPRPDESQTNLRPFRDGGVILLTLYQMAKTNNPLFYFGSVGTVSTIVGLVLAGYVAVEWITRSISHEVIAVVAGVAVLFGVQLLMFGVLSDLVVTLNREQTHQMRELAKELDRDDPRAETGEETEQAADAGTTGEQSPPDG